MQFNLVNDSSYLENKSKAEKIFKDKFGNIENNQILSYLIIMLKNSGEDLSKIIFTIYDHPKIFYTGKEIYDLLNTGIRCLPDR